MMRAMQLHEPGSPLRRAELAVPRPAAEELLLRVHACAVCRTDLHLIDGDLAPHGLPRVPGHQIVGTVVAAGAQTGSAKVGDRVGVPWLGGTCGHCSYCRTGRENLCDTPRFTGWDVDGGYAEYAIAHHRFCFALPPDYPDLQAAPLLCGGLIGYRALRFAGDAERIGFYGFGAAAHILIQVARWQGRHVSTFVRPGDYEAESFARELGAAWAGPADQLPPEPLDAAIIFAPAGELVPAALRAVRRGATVVCAGIHMSEIPSFPYSILWGERSIRSVANLTRADGEEFLAIAPQVPVRTQVNVYSLESANEALNELRAGRIRGAAVLGIHAAEGGSVERAPAGK